MWGRLHARLVAFGRTLLAAHTSPARLAAAVFVGAIVGCTPPLGLHLLLCIAAAWALGLNQVVVYAAANVSIPPLMPFIGFASIEIGERLLRGRWLPLSPSEVKAIAGGSWQAAGRMFVDWAVGGLAVGAVLGAVLATIVYAWASRRARANPDDEAFAAIDRAIAAASRRYRAAPRSLAGYAWFKYRLDPCYRRIAALVPAGSLTVDVGTGLGMLPLVLGLLGGGRRALGVDWDERKLAAARLAAAGLDGLQFISTDAHAWSPPPCDVVTLVDVLHYATPAARRELLGRAAAALGPGGALLVREGDAASKGGARFTRAVEAMAVRLGWNRAARSTFDSASALRGELEALGFTVEIEPLAGPLHPGNVLLVARRPIAP